VAEDKGFEQNVIDGIVQGLDMFADALGQSMGMPPGAQKYSQREQDEMWNFSPIASPDERAQQMMALYQQGMSVEEITDQIYPNRRKLIESGRPKIEDRIKFAKQMDRRMAKLASQYQETAGGETGAPSAPVDAADAPAPADGVTTPAGAPPPGGPPMQATPAPGWADPSGQFGLTGPLA
jgi:hypothetical protein